MGEDFFDGLRQTITGTAEAVGRKTEELVEIQKLRSRIRNAQRDVAREYRKIGEAVYHRFVDGEVMDEELAQMCDHIMDLQHQTAKYKEELANKKGLYICPACGSANPKDAAFCMHCGTEMPKDQPEPEEAFTAGPVKEQTEEEAQKEVWEACTETDEEAETAESEVCEAENEAETAAESCEAETAGETKAE